MMSILSNAHHSKRKDADGTEDTIILKSMKDFILPSLLEQDISLFHGIISDVFQGLKIHSTENSRLLSTIDKTLLNLSLQRTTSFVNKIIQIHDLQLSRYGVILVGDTASGKSTSLQVLEAVHDQLKEGPRINTPRAIEIYNRNFDSRDQSKYYHVDSVRINPKALTIQELYGHYNNTDKAWSDGLIPNVMRENSKQELGIEQHDKWIIFDGPVDSGWFVNLFNLLDNYILIGGGLSGPNQSEML